MDLMPFQTVWAGPRRASLHGMGYWYVVLEPELGCAEQLLKCEPGDCPLVSLPVTCTSEFPNEDDYPRRCMGSLLGNWNSFMVLPTTQSYRLTLCSADPPGVDQGDAG